MNTNLIQLPSLQHRAHTFESQYLATIAEHSQFAATLQTNIKTRNVSRRLMEMHKERARQSLHQLRVRFNRAVTGNGWRRKPQYTPIFVASLEGSINTYDRHKTLHYHIVIGNLFERFDQQQVEQTLRQIWPNTEVGVDDILVKTLDSEHRRGWTDYISKERTRGNRDCVDYFNAQLPPSLCFGAQLK